MKAAPGANARGAPSCAEPGKAALYVLTRRGAEIAVRLAAPLGARVYVNDKAARRLEELSFSGDRQDFDSLPELLTRTFSACKQHIFLCATGIAVRCIAPLLRGKERDPAVLVIDQAGRHVISLLSGHLGGANELARRAAAILDAQAVITTATDIEELPAIDCLAVEKGLRIGNLEALPFVSAALLNGDTVLAHDPGNFLGLAQSPWSAHFRFSCGEEDPLTLAARCPSSFSASAGVGEGLAPPSQSDGFAPCARTDGGPLPSSAKSGEELERPAEAAESGGARVQAPPLPAAIIVSPFRPPDDATARRRWLSLHPPLVCAGIGCRRGADARSILKALQRAMERGGFAMESLSRLASLDVKTDEPGLVEAAAALGLPLLFFSSRELAAFPVATPSPMARERFGLEGVCEPAALAAAAWRAGGGRLALPKIVKNGVTVALALRDAL